MNVHAFPPGAAEPVARSLRILYADDTPLLRQLLVETLGRDGHLVETVPDGEEAFGRIAGAPEAFDVLITDHHMPRLDGLALVRRLRTVPFAGKIIVYSSALGTEVSGAYQRLQVDYILAKPIFPATFRALLATF